MKTPSILIVEDEYIIAKDIQISLENMGFTVCSIVPSGEEAIAKAEKEKPDLVLMDIMLKGAIDGIEAAERIRSQFGIPVIFLTAYSDDDKLKRAKFALPFGYVLKPFKERELKIVIEIALYADRVDAERKRTEEELRKYKRIVAVSNDLMSLIDRNYIYQVVNDAYLKNLNIKREDILGHSVSEIYGREFFEKNLKPLYDRCLAGEVVRYQSWMDFPELGRRYLDILLSPYFEDDNSISGYVVNARDITDRKKAEEALIYAEQEWERTFNTIPDLIAIIDNNHRIVRVNKPMADKLGVTADEAVGQNCFECVHGAKKPPLFCPHTKMLADGREHSADICEERLGGDFLISVTPIHDIEGRLIGSVHVSRDITDRKKAEKALRDSEKKYIKLYNESKRSEEVYRSLIHSSADAIIIYDMEGRTQYVSPMFTELFGWTMEEIGGKRIPFVPDSEEETTQAIIKELVEKGTPCQGFETKRYSKNGLLLDVSISASRFDDHEGKPGGILTIHRDVSERKRLETQLLQAQKLEAVGVLAGGIAHDFNNLLSIIIGNIELLEDVIKPQIGSSVFLKEIEKASLKASDLTKQLITFSKGGAPVRKVGSIVDLLKETTNLTLLCSNFKIEYFFPHNLWLVKFDEGQMRYALKNLIANAFEAMPEGGSIEIRTENFEIRSETMEPSLSFSEGRYVKVSIRDQGVGIPEKYISRIFDPYFSTKDRGTQKGMGLGLTTTYSIIDRHDGHITVESEVGSGSTFTIYLPAMERTSED